QPGLQAIVGETLDLVTFRDIRYDVLTISPGGLIVQSPEVWPGKLLIVDFSPRFQWFTEHPENNAIDYFGTLKPLWPMAKLIRGLRKDDRKETTVVIEAARRPPVEAFTTTLAVGYQFSDKTSIDSPFSRQQIDYQNQPGLIGYTEWSGVIWL